MTRIMKVVASVGALVLLVGVGGNMQVSAYNSKILKSTVSKKEYMPVSEKIDVKPLNSCGWKSGDNPDVPGGYDMSRISVKNSVIYFGYKWEPKDNFDYAINSNGKGIGIERLKIEGTVDTSKIGVYKVKYSMMNSCSEIISATAKIEVKDGTSINVKNTKLYVGDKWQAGDDFVSATNDGGKAISPSDDGIIFVESEEVNTTKPGTHKDYYWIFVAGSVNTAKPATYKVTYWILNHNGEKVSKEATITVVADPTSINVQDSVLRVGNKWQAEDNFVSATDKDGKAVAFKDVNVKGSVNTNELGTSKVIYTILDHKKKEVSKEATITIVADKTTLEVKDSVLSVGDEWKPEDNIVKATDKNGEDISIKDIDVKGNVNTAKIGDYEVTYTVVDSKDTKIIREAHVTVKDKDKGAGSGEELPKTGYDISFIGALVGLAGVLGVFAIYLKRRQRQE